MEDSKILILWKLSEEFVRLEKIEQSIGILDTVFKFKLAPLTEIKTR